jgi:glycogen(starch) synthase
VFLGRLELYGKGPDLLLTAWAAVCGEVEGDLVVAGGGPEEPRVRRFVEKLGVGDRIRLVGWVTGRDKAELLADARLVVPSRHETFGLVAIEALAAGTPVLAFDIPCLREVLPAGVGWTVPAFDGDALAARLVDLLTGPGATETLAAAGAAGREFARAFDWDALAAAQLAIFTEVLGVAEAPVPTPRVAEAPGEGAAQAAKYVSGTAGMSPDGNRASAWVP